MRWMQGLDGNWQRRCSTKVVEGFLPESNRLFFAFYCLPCYCHGAKHLMAGGRGFR